MHVFNGSFDILELQKQHKFPGVSLLLRELVAWHNGLHRQTGVIVPSKQRVILLSLTLYFQKHSFYITLFNKYLEYFKECGLIQIWSKEYRDNYLSRRDIERKPKNLSLTQIEGIFFIQFILCLICVFVFFIELISQRFRFMRSIFSYL